MSLSNIFDPITRAYFRNKGGGSGEVVNDTDIRVATWRKGEGVVVDTSYGTLFYLLSPEKFTLQELEGAALRVETNMDYHPIKVGQAICTDMSADMGGLDTPGEIIAIYAEEGAPEFAIYIGDEAAPLFGLDRHGLYSSKDLFDTSGYKRIDIIWLPESSARLVSADGYALQDSNGLYLIPKEG